MVKMQLPVYLYVLTSLGLSNMAAMESSNRPYRSS